MEVAPTSASYRPAAEASSAHVRNTSPSCRTAGRAKRTARRGGSSARVRTTSASCSSGSVTVKRTASAARMNDRTAVSG